MEDEPMGNRTRYVALMDGKRGGYGVVFPDLPGCTAMGKTVEEALRNASDAAREWAQAVRETNNGQVPKPRPIDVVRNDPETREALAEGAALVMVPLVIDSGRPAKANLSLDAGLLEAIDEAAAVKGLTRSAFIASAAREKILQDG